jgi:hypothetical protein
MDRWGVFSVIDHANYIMVATELMLYDKIVVPTPMARMGDDWNRESEDWKRWEAAKWEPEKLADLIKQLEPKGLVVEAEWDLDRQKNWQQAFGEARAEIDRVSAEIKSGIDKRVADAKRVTSSLSKKERDQAVKAAAFAETRSEIIRHLKGKFRQEVDIYNGPVEFYAAYQSKADFEQLHPGEDAIKEGVERVNFLIQHRLTVPDEEPGKLLDCVIEKLATNDNYAKRRRLFYDWQVNLHSEKKTPEQILKELDQLVNDFNAQVRAHNNKCRQETVITVLAVAGAALAGFAGFDPSALSAMLHTPEASHYVALAGAANTAGIAVWRKLLSGKQGVDAPLRIAAPGAMFHQITGDTGFQYRPIGSR